MITADPSAAVSRPKYALMAITPIARHDGGRCAIQKSLGQDDHV